MRIRESFRRIVAGSAVTALSVVGAVLINGIAVRPAAAANVSPVIPRPSQAVTADPLATVQIDGNVTTQVVVGNKVYAGGSFSYARPAGAAPGTNQTPRGNLLAYDISTGNLDTSFNPSPNGIVKVVTKSPDGSRVYIGGSFTTASGQTRNRIAAYNTSNGALVASFAPNINGTVTGIVATNDTVYVGGWFNSANGNARTRLAAFTAANGSLLTWAPTADADVTSMVATPDGSKIVIGGRFQNINGQLNIGIAAVSAATGEVVSWPVNQVVQNGNDQAGIFALSTDTDTIYGTNYNYGTGNYEGAFAMNQDGSIKWLADCHGDTYSTFSVNGIVYTAGHVHFCANIGGYPEQNPRVEKRLVAYTKAATGTVLPNSEGGAGYGNFAGQPSPSLINYFPNFQAGNVTGLGQAVWSLAGNSTYVVAGGEFPSVGGKAQQGLVRFAISSLAPNAVKVSDLGGTTNPSIVAVPGYGIRINWKLNWDPDDMRLTYNVLRQDRSSNPLTTVSYDSTWWQRPTVSYLDKTAVAGGTYRYRVTVIDPNGNGTVSDWVSITMPSGSLSAYGKAVLDDGATNYWPLDDGDQSALSDLGGGNNLTKQGNVTSTTPGAISDDGGAVSFDGSSVAGETTSVAGPQTFTAETWVKTTSTRGGKILGFGDSSTGNSSSYDRHIYMNNSGQLSFGVYPGSAQTLKTTDSYNDGQWHYVVAELSSAGMSLWVDGIQRGAKSSVTSAQDYSGYWRIGGDNLNGWPDTGRASYFTGAVDATAIYPSTLTGAQIRDHFTKAGGSLNIPGQPSDTYGQVIYADNPNLYWRLDDQSGPAIADSGTNLQPGVAAGGITYRASSDVTPQGTGAVFNGADGTIASQKSFSGPTTYSEELWFRTTTTHGGKLIGFGDQQSGTSNNYDRHVYMENSGQLTFGTWTGQTNTTTSPKSYNDGAWHYLVATQGADGMKLYVDGQLVGTSAQTGAQDYAGYWRIGGDTAWSGDSNFFAGTIDEVAVYTSALTAAQVRAHYVASPAAVNAAPVASFTQTCTDGSCAFDGSGSTDPDGAVSAYAWSFGDGDDASGAQVSHTFSSAGTYAVKLTVTDDQGRASTITQNVEVVINQPPQAGFTSACDERECALDGSRSIDPDGEVASYSWDFGDGTTSTEASPSHTYADDGTYTVTLTVTDDQGKIDTVTHNVTAKANQKPVARFDVSADTLSVSADGSASSDADGSVASFAWDFGDGHSGSGVTASHTYDQAGDYQVTLTVTDDQGATDSITKTVTVTASTTGDSVVAADNFDQSGTRWGDADTGGTWSYANPGAFSTNDGAGNIQLPASGSATATLGNVDVRDLDYKMDLVVNQVVTGTGLTVSANGRVDSNTYYSVKVRYLSTGGIHLVASRTVNKAETVIREVNVPGLTYAAGDKLHLHVTITGSSPTALTGAVWADGSSEPANPQLNVTDSTAGLQDGGAGAVGVAAGTSSPVVVGIDNLLVAKVEL